MILFIWLFYKWHFVPTVKNRVESFQASFGPCYREGQNLTYYLPKKHIFVLFSLLFDCRQVGDLLFDLFTYGLVVVHFDFWLWDRNPNIKSKSALKLAWKLILIFFSVLLMLTDLNILQPFRRYRNCPKCTEI